MAWIVNVPPAWTGLWRPGLAQVRPATPALRWLPYLRGDALPQGWTVLEHARPGSGPVDDWNDYTEAGTGVLYYSASIVPPSRHSSSHRDGGTLQRDYWTRVTAVVGEQESEVSRLGDVHGSGSIAAFCAFQPSTTPGVTHYRAYLFNAWNSSGLFHPHRNYTDLLPKVDGDPVVVRYKQVAVGDLETAWWDGTLSGITITSETDGNSYVTTQTESIYCPQYRVMTVPAPAVSLGTELKDEDRWKLNHVFVGGS